MAFFLRLNGPKPLAVLLFAALVLAGSAQAADEPILVLDTADLDTAALLASGASEAVDEVLQGEATATAANSETLVAAPAAVERTLKFEAPLAAAVEAPSASASEDVSRSVTAPSRKLENEEQQNLGFKLGKLEELLTGLEIVRPLIGIASLPLANQIAGVEAKAITLAKEVLPEAMAALKQHKTCQSALQPKRAFELATRAGVPKLELDKDWVTLRSEMTSTLSEAMEAAEKCSAAAACVLETFRDLAAVLCIWRKLEFCHQMVMSKDSEHNSMEAQDAALLSKAKELYSTMNDAHGYQDFDLAEVSVQLAGEAGATIEPRVTQWVDCQHKANWAAEHIDEIQVGELLSIGECAKNAPMLGTKKLIDLAAKAQSVVLTEMKVLKGSDNLQPILHNLDNARRAGVDTDEVRDAEKSARVLASGRLKQCQACPEGSDGVGLIKEAFEQATLAGVDDEEIATARTALKSDCQTRLVSATTGAKRSLQDSPESTAAGARTGGRSLEESAESERLKLQILANRCLLWRKLELQEGDPDVLSEAKTVFENNVEAAFEENNLEYVVLASSLAAHCGVKLRPALHSWREVSDRVAGAAAALDEQTPQVLLDLVRQASSAALPPTQYLKAVEEKASSLITAELKKALKDDETSVEVLLSAVESAIALCSAASYSGVCSAELKESITTAQTKVRSKALAHLNQDFAEKSTPESVPAMKQAIELAKRCGVSKDEISKAWVKLQEQIQEQLIKGTTAAAAAAADTSGASGSSSGSGDRRLDTTTSGSSSCKWSIDAIKDLADILFVALKMAILAKDSEVMINANLVFTSQLQACFEAQDIPLTVQAVQLAGQAGVKCSPSIARFAAVAGRVKQAAEPLNLAGQTCPALLALVGEATEIKHHPTAELKLVEDAARSCAAAQLDKLFRGGGR